LDIKELAKGQVKMPSYDLSDMISHFYQGEIKENDELTEQINLNKKILEIQSKIKILPLTLELS
jgi:hypothetical protein